MSTASGNGAGSNKEYANVERCKTLLLDLEGNFPYGDHMAWVGPEPEELMCSRETGRALMALSKADGGKYINMRSPDLRKKLDDLASRGLGEKVEHNGIKFKFDMLANGRTGVF